MRHVEDVINGYSTERISDRKKIRVIEWFQTHPRKRFDVSEVESELGAELGVGQGQIRNYLKALTDDGVLQSHGEKRKAYELEDDIVLPAKYQLLAALRHLIAIFDTARWGIAGVFSMATVLWSILTLPFWVLWASLVIYPLETHGPIGQSEYLITALAMTVWLVVFVGFSAVLNKLHRWRSRSDPAN